MSRIYKCKYCGYAQDFSPMNKKKMKKVFPEIKDLIVGQCPSCKKSKAFK